MKKRGFSFFIIGLIYMVSISVGVIAFLIFEDLPDIARFFVADVFATLVIYACSLMLKNASLYDPYWSVIPPLLLIGAAVYYQTSKT